MEKPACTAISLVEDGARRALRFLDADGTTLDEQPIPPGITLVTFPQPRLRCTICERESAHPYSILLSETKRVRAFLAAHALHLQHVPVLQEA